jgi:hypothetical protein
MYQLLCQSWAPTVKILINKPTDTDSQRESATTNDGTTTMFGSFKTENQQ